MKHFNFSKSWLALFILLVTHPDLKAQIAGGTYSLPGTVGATAVNNLTELATLLNNNTLNGDCVFEFGASYSGTETFPIIFGNFNGPGKVIIRPASSVSTPLVTAGTTGTFAIVDLNQAHDITFDGRAGGQGTTIQWQFKNTQASASLPVFRFINYAHNDTLQYLDILCSGGSSSSTILFSTSTQSLGNINNVIQNCRIGNNAAASYTAITSTGSASPRDNGAITIKDNEIYNFQGFSNGPPTNGGIVITSTGNTAGNWKITGNSFYATLTISGSFLTGIYFAPGSGSGNEISGNYIGGRSKQCGSAGSPWIFNGYRGYTTYNDFTGIYVNGAQTVSNNVIQNIRLSNPNSGSQTFCGINIGGGATTVSGNTIGSAVDSNSIHAGGMGVTLGIWNQSTAAVTINNNVIANLTSNSAYPPTGWTYGDVIGIYCYSSGLIGNSTISNNQIFSLTTNNASNINQYFPINGGGGISSQQLGTYQRSVMAGICVQAANASNHVISGNTLYNLRSTYGAGSNTSYLHGIVANAGTGIVTVSANKIYGLTAPNNIGAAGNFVGLTGIYLPTSSLGKYAVYNNIISLGLRPNDGSSIQNALISGIWDNTNNNNVNLKLGIYHNSVYISGTNNNAYSNNLNSYAFRRMLIYSSTVYDSLLLLNNIFVNNRTTASGTGKNYGIYLNAATDVICNYNDVYGTGTNYVFSNVAGTDYTLASMQFAGFGFDGNTINTDPLFVSTDGTAPDLHIPLNSPANTTGTPNLTATYDFDGAIRANFTPVDMGATVARSACTSSAATISDSSCARYTSPSGKYTWTLTGTYNDTIANATGCDSILTINLTIKNAPSASISPASATICNGANTTLTATGGTGYAWGNGLGSNAAVTVSPTAQTTYTVTVTGANSCTATASRTVNVNQNPSAAISPTNAAICEGKNITLTASGGTGFAWSNALGNGTQVTVAPTTLTTYSVTVTDANGCTGSATKIVSVNANPNAGISSATTEICSGSALQLTASGGTTFAWSNSLGNAATVTVSPTVSTTYTVTVTDANNCSATASKSISINPAPAATISPATVTICNGDSTVLTASGGTSFAWSNSLGGSAAVTVRPSVTTSYTVTVSDGSGCSATASKTVLVNQLPAAGISPATASVCDGASTTLTATGGTSYTWSASLGNNATVNVTPQTATTYTVTVTDANGCSATAGRIVNINTSPTVSITPATVTICYGANAQLTASGGATYAWSNSLGSNATVTISPTAATTYEVTVIDANNCSATGSKTVNVNNLPIAAINGPTTICAGLSATLTASGGDSYNWSNSLGTASQITVNPSNTTNYTVTATDNNGCSATAQQTINVTNTPSASISGPSQICAGESVTLVANGGNTYQWSNGLGSAATITQSPTTLTTYTVTAIVGTNCSATASQTVAVYQPASSQYNKAICQGESFIFGGRPLTQNGSYTDTMQTINGCDSIVTVNLLVNTLPDSVITVNGNTSICQGDSVMLSAAPGHPTYQWSNNATGQSVYVKFVGTYIVTVTSVNNCSVASAPVAITVNALPTTPIITRAGDTLTTSTAVSYQWYFNNTPISGATNQAYTLAQNGTYFVEITDANGCKNKSQDFNAVNVDVIPIEEAGNIKLYPNPSTGNFVIEFSSFAQREIEIKNAIGQLIFFEKSTAQKVAVSLQASTGVYFVRIKQNGRITTLKTNLLD